MSNQSLEAIFEAEEDDRPQSERELEAHHAATQHLDREDIFAVACDVLQATCPEALMVLVHEQQENPYPVWGAYVTPDKAQAVVLAWLQAIREAQDKLAGQTVAGGIPR